MPRRRLLPAPLWQNEGRPLPHAEGPAAPEPRPGPPSRGCAAAAEGTRPASPLRRRRALRGAGRKGGKRRDRARAVAAAAAAATPQRPPGGREPAAGSGTSGARLKGTPGCLWSWVSNSRAPLSSRGLCGTRARKATGRGARKAPAAQAQVARVPHGERVPVMPVALAGELERRMPEQVKSQRQLLSCVSAGWTRLLS